MYSKCNYSFRKGQRNLLHCRHAPESILRATAQGIYNQLYPPFNRKDQCEKKYCLLFVSPRFDWCRQKMGTNHQFVSQLNRCSALQSLVSFVRCPSKASPSGVRVGKPGHCF